jgi:hypothetical protein
MKSLKTLIILSVGFNSFGMENTNNNILEFSEQTHINNNFLLEIFSNEPGYLISYDESISLEIRIKNFYNMIYDQDITSNDIISNRLYDNIHSTVEMTNDLTHIWEFINNIELELKDKMKNKDFSNVKIEIITKTHEVLWKEKIKEIKREIDIQNLKILDENIRRRKEIREELKIKIIQESIKKIFNYIVYSLKIIMYSYIAIIVMGEIIVEGVPIIIENFPIIIRNLPRFFLDREIDFNLSKYNNINSLNNTNSFL